MPYSGMTRSATRKRRQDVKDALSILYKRICTCQCIYGAVGNILNWETALLTFDMLSLLGPAGCVANGRHFQACSEIQDQQQRRGHVKFQLALWGRKPSNSARLDPG